MVDNTSPVRLLVTAILKASVIAVVLLEVCLAVVRRLPFIGPPALAGAVLVSTAGGYAMTWNEWRKYPLVFTLLWWGVMYVVLFVSQCA